MTIRPQGKADSGEWHTGRDRLAPRMSIRERVNTQLSLTSPAQIEAMEAEAAFLASVPAAAPDTKRFTDRRNPPDRTHVKPWGENRRGPTEKY